MNMNTKIPKEQAHTNPYTGVTLIPNLLISGIFITWIFITILQLFQITDDWRNEFERSEIYDNELRTIAINIGYGGFIHNFKNYILRQEQQYYEAILEDYRRFESGMAKLEKLYRTPEEYMRANALKVVIQSYMDKTLYAKELINEGREITEIDNLIKIDDSQAINSIFQFVELSDTFQQQVVKLTAMQKDKITHIAYQSLLFLLLMLALSFYKFLVIKRMHHDLINEKEISKELMAIFNGTTSAFIVVDKNGKINRANTSAALLTGYTIPELSTMYLEDLIPMGARDKHKELVSTYFKNPEHRYMLNKNHIQLTNKAGQSIPVEVGLVGIRVGKTLQVLASVSLLNENINDNEDNVVNIK